jgi:hypothetical protein
MNITFDKLTNFFNEPHEKFLLNMISILLFGIAYTILYNYDKNNFKILIKENNSEKNEYSFFYFIWFSLMSQFTVGQGNMYPSSPISKSLIAMQSSLFWFINMA